MTPGRATLLLVLGLGACRETTAPSVARQAQLKSLTMGFSKAVLPANASVPVYPVVEYALGGWGDLCLSWSSSDSAVVSLSSATGCGQTSITVNTLKAGNATLTVSYRDKTATAVVTVTPSVRFASVSRSLYTVCGLSTGGAAYCWATGYLGSNAQLGIDTTTDDCDACAGVPRPVAGGLVFAALTQTLVATCATTPAGVPYCWGPGYGPAPARVPTDLAFTTISGGTGHVCGLTADGGAYCWGENSGGQLGDGTLDSSAVPVHVAGGLHFAAISAGGTHTCGVAIGGDAYCWGDNYNGLLGTGNTAPSTVPARVAGNLRFVSLAAGSMTTCGLVSDGSAYCWGDNEWGELGVQTPRDTTCGYYAQCARTPVAVSGAQTFRLLDVIGTSTCGITEAGAAYCWGAMYRAAAAYAPACSDGSCGLGPIGPIGPSQVVPTPTRLAGSTLFAATGGSGGCWMGLDGRAYCWSQSLDHAPAVVPGQDL